MSTSIRCVLLVGAAALFSAQAATAAPRALSSVDPLVALSVFGTAQSRTAVCAAGAAAAAAGAATMAASAAAAQGPGPGCVLPVTAPAAPPPLVGQAVPPPLRAPFGIGAWAIIPGLIGLLAILALHAVDDDDDRIEPISVF
jgi:hypothetical protein